MVVGQAQGSEDGNVGERSGMRFDGPRRYERPSDGSWNGSWLFSFVFDGDDEPGDPSGLHLVICGYGMSVYHPMHRKIEITGGIGQRFRVVRW